MHIMYRRRLFKLFDKERIETAIREAEKQTSGEICVSVARFFSRTL